MKSKYSNKKVVVKTIFVLFLFFLIVGCSSSKEATANSGELNGSWKPIKQEMDGQELPLSSFDNQRLAIADSVFLFVAEGVDEGILRYEEGKMDIYVEEGVNKGKHFPAIYKLENNELTICYNLAGDKYPKAFETKSNPNFFLSVFKRE